MKKTVDLVMFDLDGTLADTGHDLADAVNFTRAHFDRGALPDQAIYAHVGRGVEHLLKHALPEESPNHFEDVMRVFLDHYEHHLLDRTVLYPGAREILEYFRDKRRVLISNKIERLAVAVVRGLGVDDQFDTILGGDSASGEKTASGAAEFGFAALSNSAGPRADGRRRRHRYRRRQRSRGDYLRCDLRIGQQRRSDCRETGLLDRRFIPIDCLFLLGGATSAIFFGSMP